MTRFDGQVATLLSAEKKSWDKCFLVGGGYNIFLFKMLGVVLKYILPSQ